MALDFHVNRHRASRLGDDAPEAATYLQCCVLSSHATALPENSVLTSLQEAGTAQRGGCAAAAALLQHQVSGEVRLWTPDRPPIRNQLACSVPAKGAAYFQQTLGTKQEHECLFLCQGVHHWWELLC